MNLNGIGGPGPYWPPWFRHREEGLVNELEFLLRARLDQRKSIGNVQETHSRGIIFSLIVWNKENHRKLSKGTAATPVLLEESENEV